MRLAARWIVVIVALSLGVRKAGNPISDSLKLELRTELVMTVYGPVIYPVLVPVNAGIARHRCAEVTAVSRLNMPGADVLDVRLREAIECILSEAIRTR